ncbi:MAG: hypothetical protein KIS96_10270 [Bauldia sp.]|nr:hypothetical protein [Bauldia sp.]
MRSRLLPVASVMALLALALVACGDDTPEEPAANEATPAEEPAPVRPAAVDQPFIQESPPPQEPADEDVAAADTPPPRPRLASPIADELGIEPELEPVVEVRQLSSSYTAMLVNEAAIDDPRELEAIARPHCTAPEGCRVGVWYNAADMPRELPVREIQIRYQVFAMGRSADGRENVLWNCNVFLEFEETGECLPRPMN